MYWPDNFESVMSLCKEAKDQDTLCWLMTVRGSVHVSQSDFSLLYPKISSLLLKMTVNPQRAIDLNINASLVSPISQSLISDALGSNFGK